MQKQLEQVKEFHKAFSVFLQGNPASIPVAVMDIRATLMREEMKEVIDAMQNEPLENIAKELADLLYVVYGTIGAYGLQDKMEKVFDEVHRSNMSKLGTDGKPLLREDGKVMKGPSYSPANIASVLNA